MKIIKEISEVAAPLIFVVLEQVLFFYFLFYNIYLINSPEFKENVRNNVPLRNWSWDKGCTFNVQPNGHNYIEPS